MKVDSTEPDSETADTVRVDGEAVCNSHVEQSDASTVRNYHDIRASLAIINGYSNALQSTFQDLRDHYGEALEPTDETSATTSSDRLMSLEADCRFCLSRLCSSVDQLKQSLVFGDMLRKSSQD